MLSPYDLERYGLTLRSLAALGRRRVRIRVFWPFPPPSRWPNLLPRERKARLQDWLRAKYRRAVSLWGPSPITHPDRTRLPLGFEGEIEARNVPALVRRMKSLELHIEEIAGRRPRREPVRPSWFAVRGRFAIRLQGVTRGMQTVEDRISLVQARSHDEATRKVRKLWKAEASPYISTTGHIVDWGLEAVTGTIELFDDEIRPDGSTEVWYSMSTRRLKPEYVWRQSKSRWKPRSTRSPRSTRR